MQPNQSAINKIFIDYSDPTDPLLPGSQTVNRLIKGNKKTKREYFDLKKGQFNPNQIGGQLSSMDLNKLRITGITQEFLNSPKAEWYINETSNIIKTLKTLQSEEMKIPIPFTRQPVNYRYPYKINGMDTNDKVFEQKIENETSDIS